MVILFEGKKSFKAGDRTEFGQPLMGTDGTSGMWIALIGSETGKFIEKANYGQLCLVLGYRTVRLLEEAKSSLQPVIDRVLEVAKTPNTPSRDKSSFIADQFGQEKYIRIMSAPIEGMDEAVKRLLAEGIDFDPRELHKEIVRGNLKSSNTLTRAFEEYVKQYLVQQGLRPAYKTALDDIRRDLEGPCRPSSEERAREYVAAAEGMLSHGLPVLIAENTQCLINEIGHIQKIVRPKAITTEIDARTYESQLELLVAGAKDAADCLTSLEPDILQGLTTNHRFVIYHHNLAALSHTFGDIQKCCLALIPLTTYGDEGNIDARRKYAAVRTDARSLNENLNIFVGEKMPNAYGFDFTSQP